MASTVNEVSLETLALARSLGSESIDAVVVGDVPDRDALTAELGAHGVERGAPGRRRGVRVLRRSRVGRGPAAGAGLHGRRPS